MDLNIRSKIKHPLILLLLCGGFLLLAPSAKAFFGIPFGIYSSQLSALSFIGDTLMEITLWLAMLSVEAATFLAVSAALLDWSSGLQINLRGNPLVDAGWNFTTGIANLLFILIFIAIALSYIFKAETFGMKKALPRLIIIALFINFSLLFVEIFVDIGWIVQNSVRTAIVGSGGFAYEAMRPVIISLEKILAGFVAQVFIYFPLALIPFAPLARLLWWGTAVVNEFTTGAFSRSVLLIIFASATGFTFLVYSVIFLIRIVIIWLLAIAAPLAFMAFILPSTQKFFSQWFRLLIQWVFLGVVMFFLMGLGIKLFAIITPSSGVIFSEVGGWLEGYLQMLFLIVYLWVAFSMSRKFIPTSMNFVQSWVDVGMKKGGAWGAGEIRKRGLQAYAKGEATMAAAKRRIDERLAAGQKLSLQQRLAKPWLRQVNPELAEAKAATARGELIKEQRVRLLAKTKDTDEEGAKAVLRAELEKHKKSTLRDKNKTAALMGLLADKDALKESDITSGMYLEAWKAAGPEDWKNNPVKKAVLARNLHWGTYNERKARIEKMTSADIDKLSTSSKENDTVIKEIIGTLNSAFISRLGSQTKTSMVKVQKEIDQTIGETWRNLKKGMTDLNEFVAHINTLTADQKRDLLRQFEAMRYIHLSPATQGTGWKKYGSMRIGAPDSIDKRIEELRKKMRP